MDWLGVDVGSPFALAAVVLRLIVATVLGGLVGWEREASHKAAGLRTHMLVAIGAAAFTIAGLDLEQAIGTGRAEGTTRVLQGIVQGIGFLGAGQIILSRGSVHGMTTAVGIWVIGAIGVACGAGLYVLAITVTVFALGVLRGVAVLERRMDRADDDLGRSRRASPRRRDVG